MVVSNLTMEVEVHARTKWIHAAMPLKIWTKGLIVDDGNEELSSIK